MHVRHAGTVIGSNFSLWFGRAVQPGPFAIWLFLITAYFFALMVFAGVDWDWQMAVMFLVGSFLTRILHVAVSPKLPVWAKAWTDKTPVLEEAKTIVSERHWFTAQVWKRRDEWVLELSGTIGDTFFTSRHTEPLSTPVEDVPGLPSRYRETLTPEALSSAISTGISELGDRTSPEDQPDMMLVTSDEIRTIVEKILAGNIVVSDPEGI